MNKQWNQTTLGVAVSLHHKFGSKELLSMMYDLCFTASYTEVLRFRSSVAKYTGEKHLEYESLSPDRGLVTAWFDNYDLNVYTPNGRRETNAMAIEFIQHTLPWFPAVREFRKRPGNTKKCFPALEKSRNLINLPKTREKSVYFVPGHGIFANVHTFHRS